MAITFEVKQGMTELRFSDETIATVAYCEQLSNHNRDVELRKHINAKTFQILSSRTNGRYQIFGAITFLKQI